MLDEYGLILNISEVCEILRLSENSVYDLLRNKELAGFLKKGKWFIPKDSIYKFLDNNLEKSNF